MWTHLSNINSAVIVYGLRYRLWIEITIEKPSQSNLCCAVTFVAYPPSNFEGLIAICKPNGERANSTWHWTYSLWLNSKTIFWCLRERDFPTQFACFPRLATNGAFRMRFDVNLTCCVWVLNIGNDNFGLSGSFHSVYSTLSIQQNKFHTVHLLEAIGIDWSKSSFSKTLI